jgi:tetratricopeptide (TPR) repeat protein
MRGGAALVVLTTVAWPVYAQGPSAGGEALSKARAAWDRGEYDTAEPLYRQAIELGGLAPAEVLDAYVRLGASRAVLGKNEPSLAAFKAAALINNRFTVPPEAGRRAILIAERARRAEAQVGAIDLHADVPSSLEPGQVAAVDASLDPTHAAVASKVAVVARDPTTGKTYEQANEAATSVHFNLPASLALPNATLVVRVDALDRHGNRLASVEQRIRVGGSVAGAPPPVTIASSAKSPDMEEKHEAKGHGFWSTPWPYVIGGAALAAGGAAVYFATRPSDDVNVGTVHVNLTP